MAKMIFIFLDGVGIGQAVRTNPFFATGARFLPFYENGCLLPDQTPIKPIDAQLGVEGMPMSATGQTTLFTGINIPVMINQHRDSYPDRVMRKVIKEKSLFSILRKHKVNPRFINAFPGSYYLFTPEHIYIRDDGEFHMSVHFQTQFKRSLSVTTCMMIASMMRPFSENDIRRERALYHDFTNQALEDRQLYLPRFTPEKAAEILYRVAQEYDLLLYEYFQTDLFGHGFESHLCNELVTELDRMVGKLISLMNPGKDTLVITSDHGNLEDLTTPLHTFNPVPLLVWGFKCNELREQVHSLVDVRPAMVEYFQTGQ